MARNPLIALFTVALLAGGFFAGALVGDDLVQPAEAAQVETPNPTVATPCSDRPGGGGPGGLGYPGEDSDGVLAAALGMTAEEFHAALQSGMTIAEIATDQGKDVEAVKTMMVSRATVRIEAAVAAGEMTQERADLMLDGLEARISDKVENGTRGQGFGPMGQERGTGGGFGSQGRRPGGQNGVHTPGTGGGIPNT